MSKTTGINILLLAICALCISLLVLQRAKYHGQLEQRDESISNLAIQIDSVSRMRSGGLLNEVISMVRHELDTSANRTLSDETISFLSNSSKSFAPIQFRLSDSIVNHSLSPERGQLLIYLLTARIDSNSLAAILSKTEFNYADMRGVSLESVNLLRAKLSGSSFAGATLTDVDLSGSNLTETDFNTAHLQRVKFTGCNMVRSSMRWVKANDCNFSKARISGADLTLADISGSVLISTNAQNCRFNGTLMMDVDATEADFLVADLSGANLTDVIMVSADLRHANLSGAVLLRTNMTKAKLDFAAINDIKWVERLSEYNVNGRDTIALDYEISAYTANAYPAAPYLLRRVAD